MLFSIFDVLRIYEALSIFFYKFLLKWEKKWRFWVHHILWSSKILLNQVFLNQGLIFFPNGHICNVVSLRPTLWKSTLKMTTLFRRCLTLLNSTLKNSVVSTLFNVVNFNADVHNVVSLTLYDVGTSYQPKNNVEATLKCLLGYT